jgi:hypothetical protein
MAKKEISIDIRASVFEFEEALKKLGQAMSSMPTIQPRAWTYTPYTTKRKVNGEEMSGNYIVVVIEIDTSTYVGHILKIGPLELPITRSTIKTLLKLKIIHFIKQDIGTALYGITELFGKCRLLEIPPDYKILIPIEE